MKFLIAGTGSIGRRHYKNILSLGYRDIAVVRSKRHTDAPQREFFAKYRPQVFYSLEAALTGKPDAVFVCNPTSLHVSTARSAIRAGSHVFIEKPISHTRAGIDALLREARQRKKVVYVGYNFRHHPLLKTAKRILEGKKLGTLHSARFITGEYLPDWHPWENYRKSYAARKDLGGGVVLTQSHDLDLIYWLLGKPQSVAAVVRTGKELGANSVDHVASMIFTTEHCPTAFSHLDYLERSPTKHFIISGSRGRITWDYYGNTLRLIKPKGKMLLFKTPSGFERNHMYVAELNDFIRCIRQGKQPATDVAAGRVILEMALRAKEASAKQRMLKFS
ncbi:MAG: Gfo/Idh/MocA family oxidoreductase [Candidatus Sungbacteria bacterium]|uniref:Gfo/Idh/MocA family oxidoreductase n=1 Tax=Candidatus Sungiibacteriota bacterium TaxID=2750080 RepID=A0A932YVX1_9BACT|nr:Gfo/Idh/MocA family oxidoreductase [Candidatus Sungbacteria bacterium]MBI4132318.1 Gfo/Idh/MocA family oxidoreductase [Candidatus Sungbacteria bacterium]